MEVKDVVTKRCKTFIQAFYCSSSESGCLDLNSIPNLHLRFRQTVFEKKYVGICCFRDLLYATKPYSPLFNM